MPGVCVLAGLAAVEQPRNSEDDRENEGELGVRVRVQCEADRGVERPGDAAGEPDPRSFAHEHLTEQIIRRMRPL